MVIFILGKKSNNQKPRQPKQLEDEFDDADEDEIEDDDYVDPFNVDDGLLQDENVVEEFPDEDEEMEDSGDETEEESTNVPRLPEEEDEEEVPEEEYDENEDDETEETTNDPNDDAETVGTTNGTKPRRRPTFFHCIMGGYGPFGPIRSIGHIGFGAVVPVIGRARPRVPKLIASIPSSFPLGLQGTYTTMVKSLNYDYC